MKFLTEVIKRYNEYPKIEKELQNWKVDFNEAINKANKLREEIDNLKAEQQANIPSVDNADYWDKKFPQVQIFYSAPVRKSVTSYVEPRQVLAITQIADKFIQDEIFISADDVPLAVMNWLNELFFIKRFKYKLDKGEIWELPETTLNDGYGDCDSWGIVEYYLIKEIFVKLGDWETMQHRLKCQVVHVHEFGQNYPYAGVHFNLLWLHSSGDWMTIESTFHLERAIANFGEKPQKYNPQYGLIVCTFNDTFAWAQNAIDVSRLDFKKVKK